MIELRSFKELPGNPKQGHSDTPTPWLTLLLVLGKSRDKQNSCWLSVREGISVSQYVLSEEWELFENVC